MLRRYTHIPTRSKRMSKLYGGKGGRREFVARFLSEHRLCQAKRPKCTRYSQRRSREDTAISRRGYPAGADRFGSATGFLCSLPGMPRLDRAEPARGDDSGTSSSKGSDMTQDTDGALSNHRSLRLLHFEDALISDVSPNVKDGTASLKISVGNVDDMALADLWNLAPGKLQVALLPSQAMLGATDANAEIQMTFQEVLRCISLSPRIYSAAGSVSTMMGCTRARRTPMGIPGRLYPGATKSTASAGRSANSIRATRTTTQPSTPRTCVSHGRGCRRWVRNRAPHGTRRRLTWTATHATPRPRTAIAGPGWGMMASTSTGHSAASCPIATSSRRERTSAARSLTTPATTASRRLLRRWRRNNRNPELIRLRRAMHELEYVALVRGAMRRHALHVRGSTTQTSGRLEGQSRQKPLRRERRRCL